MADGREEEVVLRDQGEEAKEQERAGCGGEETWGEGGEGHGGGGGHFV